MDDAQDNNENHEQLNPIAGFWRRLGAFVLDILLLGIFGWLLGTILEEQFVQLGGWGRVLGFVIAGLYFGLMNSEIGAGQTFGKRLLKIKVIDNQGNALTIRRSFLRYTILGIPYFLNGAQYSEELLMSPMTYLLSLLMFGLGLSIIYLFVFNRATRQTVHDLAVGSYVVHQVASGPPIPKAIWKVHYAIVGCILITSVIVPVFTQKLAKTEFFTEMLKVRRSINELPMINYATISVGKSTSISTEDGTRYATYITSQVFIKQKDIDYEKLASQVAEVILKEYARAETTDMITIVITYGYDIGISSLWRNQTFSLPPSDWSLQIMKQLGNPL